MPDVPQQVVVAKDFVGLVTNLDRYDLPPSASEVQVNATCLKTGELNIRLGLRQVKFEAT